MTEQSKVISKAHSITLGKSKFFCETLNLELSAFDKSFKPCIAIAGPSGIAVGFNISG